MSKQQRLLVNQNRYLNVYYSQNLYTDITSVFGMQIYYNSWKSQLNAYPNNEDPKVISYAGNLEYVNGNLSSIYHEEGRIVYNNTEPNYPPNYAEYNITDHLGNTRVRCVDKDNNGKIKIDREDPILNELGASYHYYPFGLQMEGNFFQPTGVKERHRYNGIEHVDEMGIDLSFATYRTHDAAIGRWLQVDPMAESLYGMSPYNSMGNNPINASDPNGDIAQWAASGLIMGGINTLGYMLTHNPDDWTLQGAGLSFVSGFVTGALFGNPFTSYNGVIGDAVGGLGLPGNVSLNFTGGAGTNGGNVGFDLTYGIGIQGTNVNLASLSVGGSVSGSTLGTGGAGAEGRISIGLGATVNGYGAMVGTNLYGDTQGTSQSTGFAKVYFGSNKKYLLYENDWIGPGASGGDGGLLGDGGDRWRTGGMRFQWGKYSGGFNMFTGDPGLRSRSSTEGVYDQESNKYRAGVGYFGIGNHKFGINSDWLRHGIQNRLLHDGVTGGKAKHFSRESYGIFGGHGGPFYYYGGSKNYSVW